MFHIYTDGSCVPNPGFGKYGFVAVIEDKEKNETIVNEFCKSESNTTNNRMEMKAIVSALEYAINLKEKVTIYSDSQLSVDTYNKWMDKWHAFGWKRKKNSLNKSEVKNLDVVQELWILKSKAKHCELKWIKGHSGHKWNDYVDHLVN